MSGSADSHLVAPCTAGKPVELWSSGTRGGTGAPQLASLEGRDTTLLLKMGGRFSKSLSEEFPRYCISGGAWPVRLTSIIFQQGEYSASGNILTSYKIYVPMYEMLLMFDMQNEVNYNLKIFTLI